MPEILVETQNLSKHFPMRSGLLSGEKKVLHAVDDVTLSFPKGETLGLAGESGSGKSTLGRLLLMLLSPTTGTVHFKGQDIFKFGKEEKKNFRRETGIIFQNPLASLNPRKTIRQILSRPSLIYKTIAEAELENRVLELLEMVEIAPAERYIDRYPHELSGGQRQRIGIARAIALGPIFIVADEPVSSLDVSVRAGILELMKRLQEQLGLTYIFITHDLSVLRAMCQRTAIMYAGKIVEVAEVDEFYSNPLHPYARALLSATPIPNPRRTRSRERTIIRGEVASPIDPPPSCRFHPRCPQAMAVCSQQAPPSIQVGQEHEVACWLYRE